MDFLDLAIFVPLGFFGGACAAYWSVVLYHVVRTRLEIPTARAGLAMPLPDPAPRVCVVIPAHNEQAVIATVARSLLAQDYPDLRVVFCLDRCTDQTESILRHVLAGDARFEIVINTSCPDDWAGKVHAVHRGVQDSLGAGGADLLLFADADTRFEPACVRACVGLLQSRQLVFLSLLSTLTHDRWFERAVQPAASMELIRQYPMRRSNARGARRRAFANGQFMLIRRAQYEAIGGHEALRHALLEDIELARRIAHAHLPAGLFLADGMLHCRMYPDWPAFRRGWRRIYTEAANRRAGRLRTCAARVLWTAVVLPLGSLLGAILALAMHGHGTIAAAGGAISALGLITWVFALVAALRMGGSPLACLPFHPVGSWMVAGILREAARDLEKGSPTVWGGRTYARASR